MTTRDVISESSNRGLVFSDDRNTSAMSDSLHVTLLINEGDTKITPSWEKCDVMLAHEQMPSGVTSKFMQYIPYANY